MSLKLLKTLLTQILKDESNFKKTKKEERRTKHYLQSRLSILEVNFQASVAANREAIMKAKDDESTEVEDVYEKIRETYVEYRTDLLNHLDKIEGPIPCVPSTTPVNQKQELRLPKINLPSFSGSYETWRSFHDLFLALIHKNPSLSEIQKLHYLKSSLTGEADRLLQHLTIDVGNYDQAWVILTNRYDHKRVLVNTQLKLLFGQPVVSVEGSNALKRILDTSTECLHALSNLGVDVKNWDVLVIHIMLQKLPVLTQQLWEEKLGSKKDLPTFDEFSQFLEARFRTLEAVDQQKQKPIHKPEAHSRQVTKTSFHVQSNPRQQYCCKVCSKGQHSPRKCNKFLTMQPIERGKTVRRLGICENCLAYSHNTPQCPSRMCCYFCNARHHSLLHIYDKSSPYPHPTLHDTTNNTVHYSHTSTQQPDIHTQTNRSTHLNTRSQSYQTTINPNAQAFHPTEQPSTSSALNNFHTQHNTNTQVLLATALVKVKAASGEYLRLRALIDPGSEATFITGSAVQLQWKTYIC